MNTVLTGSSAEALSVLKDFRKCSRAVMRSGADRVPYSCVLLPCAREGMTIHTDRYFKEVLYYE